MMLSFIRNCSQAYAAARMAESCLLGLQGKDNIYECAYVESSLIPELSYFASKVREPHMRGQACAATNFHFTLGQTAGIL